MTDDYTPIEKMWQRLFDQDGQPLPRLGEFLRGLALHLIEDYEPKKSLVITPSKMLQFYEQVKLQDEVYPWSSESFSFQFLREYAKCIQLFLELSHHRLCPKSIGTCDVNTIL